MKIPVDTNGRPYNTIIDENYDENSGRYQRRPYDVMIGQNYDEQGCGCE
jgi:hypothetical protein